MKMQSLVQATLAMFAGAMAFACAKKDAGTGPAPAPQGFALAAVSAGDMHTCGVTPGSVAYCWGNNGAGQLGDRTLVARNAPVRVTIF
jgi:alpha-tubulin suppressor-like RCC1 family protein